MDLVMVDVTGLWLVLNVDKGYLI